ncbi:MAG: DUF6531 domain-containing protein [Methylococcaceae bacterium]
MARGVAQKSSGHGCPFCLAHGRRSLLLTVIVVLILGLFEAAGKGAQAATGTPNDNPVGTASHNSAIVSNGTVMLGVADQGHLNVAGGTLSSGNSGTTVVGLRYVPTNGEATAPGCLCEGWGIADAGTGQAAHSDIASGGVGVNMVVNSFGSTSIDATSVVTAFGRLRVTHFYHPHPLTPFLYVADITIDNVSATDVSDLRYTRVMDWDIPPDTFNEHVTIAGVGSAANLLYADDNGFQSPDPLLLRSPLLQSGNQVDTGPADHGALFDFGFGALRAGESKSFRIFYGAAGNEVDALGALAIVGAEAYSLGQPSTGFGGGGPVTGTPNTFIFGFSGIGGGALIASPATFGGQSSANPFGIAAEPVNTATGNYFYQHADLSTAGRGLPFVFARTYNALDSYSGPLGHGWTHSYNLRLTEKPGGSVTVKQGDGHEEFYDPTGGGNFTSRLPGVFNILVKNSDGSFILTAKDQTQYHFDSVGRFTEASDRNGNSLVFGYDPGGDLITVTDTVGRTISLSYDANHRITAITDPAGHVVRFAYDADGNLISDTDPNDGVMNYSYDAAHRVTRMTDRRGNILIENTYDVTGRVVSQTNGRGFTTGFAYDTPNTDDTSITDPRGNTIIHTHDTQFRLITETDPLGHKIQYVYDANNNRTSVTDKNGKVTTFTYDTQGNVLSKTDAQVNITTLEYNSLNDPTRIVDALGQITAFAYDAKGNLNEVTDALGNKTKVTYDTSGQPASITDARGGVTLNTFNAQGNLTQVEDALGNKTKLTYDAIGRRTGMTDANSHAASFTYDNNGNLVSVTDPLSHATSFTYDANNNRTGVTDPRGNATAFVYDANDLLSKATDPLGNFVQSAYDAADNRIKITDPRGNITQYAYDAANRLTQMTDTLNHSTTLAYDANGNLLIQTNPLGHTSSFAYDELNRLLNATDALGNKGFRSYDALGRLTQAKDAQGRITQYAYDALGRLTKVTDAKSGTVVYDYDALGNRIAVTDPNGHTTGYSYDALNRLTAKTDPLGQAYSYSYDPVGNRVSLTDAKGQNLLYSYDGNNRLTAIDYPDTTQVTFGYDAAGNRTQMIDKLGTSTYVFDTLNRLAEYTDAFGKTVGNEYDKAGNRTALIYPDGKRVTYAYDALNRMASVTDWLNGVTDYSYDAASKLAEVLNPNNTKAVYGYDAAERLVNLANAKADTSVLANYALTLDAVGNRSGIDRIEPLAPIFTNKTQALTFDNDNRLLTLDAAAVTHDPNGNLTAEPGKSFQYDFEDRLVAAAGNQSAEFSYDGVGNRLAAKRNGQTTRYTLDVSGALTNVLVENDGAGNPTAYYVHGLGLISRITPSGDARYYHYDTIGSTVALTDAVGNVTDSYAYDPFGQILNAQGTVNNPFRYVGQFGVMEEGNGLQFMRARYYEAGVGRFLNKDAKLGEQWRTQTLNLYAYTINNPVTYIDIDGREPVTATTVVIFLGKVALTYAVDKFIINPLFEIIEEYQGTGNNDELGEGATKDVSMATIGAINPWLGLGSTLIDRIFLQALKESPSILPEYNSQNMPLLEARCGPAGCNNFNDPALVMISSDGTALVSNCGPAGCPRIAVNNDINDKSRSQTVSRK